MDSSADDSGGNQGGFMDKAEDMIPGSGSDSSSGGMDQSSGGDSGGGSGMMDGMKDKMMNQEVNSEASKMDVPQGADSMIDKEVDKYD